MKRLFSIVLALAIAVTGSAQDGRKYEIRSGIAKMVTEAMGQKMESTVYFDNYGALETDRVNANGMEISTINKEGKTYVVNHTMKNVRSAPAQNEINFLNLTEEIIKQYKIGMIGFEKIGEWNCQKYTYEIDSMGQTLTCTAWVWKGIAVKNVAQSGGMEIILTMTELQENAKVDPAVFEVPTFQLTEP